MKWFFKDRFSYFDLIGIFVLAMIMVSILKHIWN